METEKKMEKVKKNGEREQKVEKEIVGEKGLSTEKEDCGGKKRIRSYSGPLLQELKCFLTKR